MHARACGDELLLPDPHCSHPPCLLLHAHTAHTLHPAAGPHCSHPPSLKLLQARTAHSLPPSCCRPTLLTPSLLMQARTAHTLPLDAGPHCTHPPSCCRPVLHTPSLLLESGPILLLQQAGTDFTLFYCGHCARPLRAALWFYGRQLKHARGGGGANRWRGPRYYTFSALP